MALLHLDTQSYNLYLSSGDKVSGNNNNAIFNVNWAAFLPRDYDKYNVSYSFQSSGGFYKDNATAISNFNGCKIVVDFGSRSLSYDTSITGQSSTLGFAQRDMQTTTSSSNSFSSFFYQYPPKTILKPTQNSLNIKIYNIALQANLSNQLLQNTISTGATLTGDMTSWNMVISFTPILASHQNVLQASYTK